MTERGDSLGGADPSPVLGMTSDSELLARARAGGADAFRELVTRYEPVVATTVIGMLGRGDDADDVGQETFIRFYRALDQFREDSSLKTYLIRIAMNLSLNALKQRKRSALRFISRDQQNTARLEPHAQTVALDATSERDTIIKNAVQQLSEKHRPVVVLRMLQGLSTRDTALALGLPEGTVLSRLSRALKELAVVLGPFMKSGMLSEDI